jgi:hypothetical protein
MKAHKQWWWTCAVMVAGLAFILQSASGVRAQDAQATANSQGPQDTQNTQNTDVQDPPSRIARLNYMEGSVSFQPGGETDWVTAVPNRPVVTGDNLWADEDSRAEVHIGSTALRLGPKTGITLLEVSDRVAQIRLAQGSLIVRVRHVYDEDSYEIDTPNVAFVVMQPGDYRLDVGPDGNRTEVTVWGGRGQVTGGGNSYTVVANQHAVFGTTGTDQLNYNSGQIQQDDGFDNWAFGRDRTEDSLDSANYVSRDMTGYEDLDQYGSWNYVAGYGTVWQPAGIAVGWAPYRFGHWTWVGPWGWTWVEDEPWGFAPFHYGRWALSGTGWVWIPGPRMVRPVYAPALVAWVGGGPGFRFSAGAGVGWFPLAPGEVFIPGYRVSRGYVNNVNVTNTAVSVTRVTNVYNTVVVNREVNSVTYANRNVSGGVTVVSNDTFINARQVARNVAWVPSKELAAVPVSHVLAVEPAKSSVLGAGKPAANQPPAAVMSRTVVALRTPARMPNSFDQRQGGGPLNQQPSTGQSSMAQSSIGQSLVRQVAPGRPMPVTRQPPTQSQAGFHSIGEADAGSTQARPQPRVWEEQGTPEPEKSTQAQTGNRSVQPSASRPQQQGSQQPTQQASRPQVRPVASVQGRSEQQQKPAPPAPQRQQNSRTPAPKPESAPKK